MVDVKVELADLVDVDTEVEGWNDQPSVRLEMYSQLNANPLTYDYRICAVIQQARESWEDA